MRSIKQHRNSGIYNSAILMLFCLPGIAIYTIMFVLPILGNLLLSFTDWNGAALGMGRIGFVGLSNFIELFTDDRLFYRALSHNLVYAVTVVIVQNILALLFALLLSRRSRVNTVIKTVYLLPVILSTLTLSLIWSYIYDPMMGALNQLLRSTGLGFLAQSWLGNPDIALYSVAFVNSWQWAGYSMIIYIAGLNAIPKDLYEAADISGASKLRVFTSITLPLLLPAITINVVLATLGCMKVFGLVYVMTGGGPNNATEVLATLIYRVGFNYSRMGYAAAMSIVLLVIIMAIGFTQTILLRRMETQL